MAFSAKQGWGGQISYSATDDSTPFFYCQDIALNLRLPYIETNEMCRTHLLVLKSHKQFW